MILYFTGAHSTGKTSLVDTLHASYVGKELTIITETARTAIQVYGKKLTEIRKDLYLNENFQNKVIELQLQAEAKCNFKNYISDRSLVDALAYSSCYCSSDFVKNKLAEEGVQKHIETLKHEDTLVFFIRPNKELLEDDSVREFPDALSVARIDGAIKTLLVFLGIPYIQIDTTNFSERVNLVNNVIAKVFN